MPQHSCPYFDFSFDANGCTLSKCIWHSKHVHLNCLGYAKDDETSPADIVLEIFAGSTEGEDIRKASKFILRLFATFRFRLENNTIPDCCRCGLKTSSACGNNPKCDKRDRLIDYLLRVFNISVENMPLGEKKRLKNNLWKAIQSVKETENLPSGFVKMLAAANTTTLK